MAVAVTTSYSGHFVRFPGSLAANYPPCHLYCLYPPSPFTKCSVIILSLFWRRVDIDNQQSFLLELTAQGVWWPRTILSNCVVGFFDIVTDANIAYRRFGFNKVTKNHLSVKTSVPILNGDNLLKCPFIFNSVLRRRKLSAFSECAMYSSQYRSQN